jgi:hypothetical protein
VLHNLSYVDKSEICLHKTRFSTLPFSHPAWILAKRAIFAIDTLEVQKHVMFSAAMSLQHLEDRRLEIIIDRHAWHSSPERKGMVLTEQEGFLPLGGEAFDKHRS